MGCCCDNRCRVHMDGKDYEFVVLTNLAKPCPHCGVPACGREDFLWYEENGQRLTLVFDGMTFDTMAQAFFEGNTRTSQQIPDFLNQWFMHRGWRECREYDGHPLRSDDIQAAVGSLQKVDYEGWLKEDAALLLQNLQEIAVLAAETSGKLRIVRG